MSTDSPAFASAPVEERPPARRACVVRLGGQPFAVDVLDSREVVVLDTITPVPGAPAPLVGVMNLRGTALPVIEVRPLLGLPVQAAIRALVVADGDRRAGILIEGVLGLVGFDEVDPGTGAEGVPAALARGRVRADSGDAVTLLDGPALLAAARRAWDLHAEPMRATSLRPGRMAPAGRAGA